MSAGNAMYFCFVIMALGLTFISTKRPEILLRLAASFLWLGLAFWFVLDDTSVGMDTDKSWTWIIIGALLLMCFVPLVFQMNTEVRNESKGRMWSNWQRNFTGDSEETVYEKHRRELRSRLRRRPRRYY